MSHLTGQCFPIVVLFLLSMVSCKDNFPDRDSGTPDADADIDADGDGDGDADADSDGDGDGDGDVDADADGDEEGDADDGPCELAPSGIDPETVVGVGCPWVGDPGLTDLIVNEECSLSTDTCTFGCSIFARSCEAPMLDGHAACVIAANTVEIGPNASITVRGSRPLIIMATGPVAIRGQILANATNQNPGPSGGPGVGVRTPALAPEVGSLSQRRGANRIGTWGRRGAGHAAEGGSGGCDSGGAGGPLVRRLRRPISPWRIGGGAGGSDWIGMATEGGGGGGAVEIFSLERIDVESSGLVDASGGDGAQGYDGFGEGMGGGGGGSGGTRLSSTDGHHRWRGEGLRWRRWRITRGKRDVWKVVQEAAAKPPAAVTVSAKGPAVRDLNASGGGGAAGRIYIRTVDGALAGNGVVVPALAGCISHTSPSCD